MPWVCNDCGNTKYFCGRQHITRYGTERVIVNSSGEVEDTSDFDEHDCDVGDMEIHSCNDCDSENIRNLIDVTFEQWKNEHFDENDNFIKDRKTLKISSSTKAPSANKLKLLADELLSNKISVEEYRQKKDEIMQRKGEIRKILVDQK